MVRTSGHCSMISKPTVPWPATMSGWSNGWMNTAPVDSAYSLAATSVSSMIEPWNRTSAPYPVVAATLGSGAPTGMNTVDFTPSTRAARATPCAWLPALAATTPMASSDSDSLDNRTYAPRTLNEPARWRFSHLSMTGPPTRSDSASEPSTGVTRLTSRSSSRAASISPSETVPGSVDMTVSLSSFAGILATGPVPQYPVRPLPLGPRPRRRGVPVAIRSQDQRGRADQPGLLAERGRNHPQPAAVRHPQVLPKGGFDRLEQQRPGLRDAATDRDHLEIAEPRH